MFRIYSFILFFTIVVGASFYSGSEFVGVDSEATPTPEVSEENLVYDKAGIPMVFVPEGTFTMGYTFEQQLELCVELRDRSSSYPCSREDLSQIEGLALTPATVEIGAFYMDKYEVSIDAYMDCVTADVCYRSPHTQYWSETNLPMSPVSFYDAAIYCAWRDARLPTEEEWEYAARGPDNNVFPWGNGFDGERLNFCDTNCDTEGVANQNWDDGFTLPSSVDYYDMGQSWVGVYNMGGNVAEWTNSRHFVNEPIIQEMAYAKGGSYLDYAHLTAGWTRFPLPAQFGQRTVGFRCARTTDPRLD